MKHQRVSFNNEAACGAKLRTRKAEEDPNLVTCPKCKDLTQHKNGLVTSIHGYYLVGFNSNDEIRAIDGHHSFPSDVQKALELYKQLNLFKPELTYKMVKLERDVEVPITWKIGQYRGEALRVAKDLGLLKVSEVPTKYKPRINKEAVSIIGRAVQSYKSGHNSKKKT